MFRSPYPDVDIPDVSVYDYLFASLTEDEAARVALIDPATGAETTYGVLRGQVDAFAGALAARGAGTETVMRLLGNAAVLLAEHDDQRADLAANPDLMPNAVEELLRFEAPSPVQGRWTTREVEMHGTTIPVDSKVLLLTGSAGRDERAFPDPGKRQGGNRAAPRPGLARGKGRAWLGWRAGAPQFLPDGLQRPAVHALGCEQPAGRCQVLFRLP